MNNKFLFKPTFLLVLLIRHSLAQTATDDKFSFHRSNTGVVFSPYIKHAENDKFPPWDSYKLEEIRTMYQVMVLWFQMTATYGTGSRNEIYEPNASYQRAQKAVLSAEAASLVNLEHNKLAATTLIGVWRHENSPQQMNTEIELAFESAQIANRNYPGTATGIIFTSNDIEVNPGRANVTLNQITDYKERAHREDLLVGTRQNCDVLTNKGEKNVDEVAEIFRTIISRSDFVICHFSASRQNLTDGVDAIFDHVKKEMLGYREEILKTNPSVEVIMESGWPSKDTTPEGNSKNLVQYWKLVDKWAQEVNIKALMFEAFDSPWKKTVLRASHFGWWRLITNARITNKLGYAEKLADEAKEEAEKEAKAKEEVEKEAKAKEEVEKEAKATRENDTTSYWVYVGAAVGSFVFCLLVFFICLLYIRVNRLQQVLTKQDIAEFMNGISNENTLVVASENGEIESALRIPYIKEKFEIEKDRIDIKQGSLLGSGQFGCVYKAVVETKAGGLTEVAIKMAKTGCSATGLKSILSEIKILTYLGTHPNIVSIVGAYTGELEKGIVYLISEICKLGSLQEYLRNEQFIDANGQTDCRYANVQAVVSSRLTNESNVLYTNQRNITHALMITWAHEIACGMEYLGTKNVVHADLATRNVLLTAQKTAKITDFGLSRRMYAYTNYVKKQQEPLPWRWMAVESLKKLQFSSASDVWSYGVTLWEIFSLGDLPYPGLAWNLEFVDSLETGLRMTSPKYSTPETYHIMSKCWAEDANERPTFTALKIVTGELIAKRESNDLLYSNLKL